MKKIEDSDCFEAEHRYPNPVTCVEYARFNKSIIYVIIHMQKVPISMLSRSETPKTQEVEDYTHE